MLKYTFLLLAVMVGCHKPSTHSSHSAPSQHIQHVQQYTQIEEPKIAFILEYNCQQKSQRYNTKEAADTLQQTLDAMGFETKYRRWQLLPSPIDNGPFNNPFNRRKPPVYHLVYYWTNSPQQKEFENLDSARLWQMKLQDLGCSASISQL